MRRRVTRAAVRDLARVTKSNVAVVVGGLSFNNLHRKETMNTQSSPILAVDVDPELRKHVDNLTSPEHLYKFADALATLIENFNTPWILTECIVGYLHDVAPTVFPRVLQDTHINEARKIRERLPLLSQDLADYEYRCNEQIEIEKRIRAAGGYVEVMQKMLDDPKTAPVFADGLLSMVGAG
jgi:hypothetical protein